MYIVMYCQNMHLSKYLCNVNKLHLVCLLYTDFIFYISDLHVWKYSQEVSETTTYSMVQ